MNTTENQSLASNTSFDLETLPKLRRPAQFPPQPQEWKAISLRECPVPSAMQIFESPEQAAGYWKTHVSQHPYFNPECECLVVLILNARLRIKGHYLVSIGTMDSVLCHPREVFKIAIVANAAALILIHNHPSGEPNPSNADIRMTRDLIQAGQLLKIEVLDHLIMGNPDFVSLKTLGFFYS
jgi:DNA repair protein RadC